MNQFPKQLDQSITESKRATMRNVADHAGVVISTVSHVLNDTAKISEDTRQRVLKSIEELNYIPNNLARELRQKRTKIIGVVVPDLANEFYAKSTSGIMKAASQEEHIVLVCNTDYDLKREKIEVETLIKQRVDGIIFLGGTDDSIVEMVRNSRIPVVLGDRYIRGFSSVEFDNDSVIRNLVQQLYESGYRRFGYVGESLTMTNLRDRFQGFKSALASLHLSFNANWVLLDQRLQLEKLDTASYLIEDFLKLSGKANSPRNLNSLPEVIITSSDLIAIGVVEGLKKYGYSVPQDIGVCGFDDIAIARFNNPTLTTIRQDTVSLGGCCFTLLQKVIGQITFCERIVIKGETILRDSTLTKSNT